MLEEGRGGFADFHKYRDSLIKIFWDLEAGDQAPETALEEAKRLRDQMMAQSEPEE